MYPLGEVGVGGGVGCLERALQEYLETLGNISECAVNYVAWLQA